MRLTLALLALAVALMVPELIIGETTRDSWALNITWARQFSEQLQSNPYPRWLERSFDGFGAPVFYFYPPLAFYLTAAVHYLTTGHLSTFNELVGACMIALFASGLAMRGWIREVGGREWLAAAYMLAPYHIIDIYDRGALAEFCAYAMIPLVMIGLKRVIEGRGSVFLAIAYAGLAMTHLPTAVLTSALLITPYALWRRQNLPQAAVGVILGAALAAIYLVPALTLPINQTELYRSGLRVADWYFWRWTPQMTALGPVLGVIALMVLLSLKRSFWGLLSIGICLIIIGVIPILLLPILNKVQFPFRALSLVEFCVVTRLALEAKPPLPKLAMAIYPLILAVIMIRPPAHSDLRAYPDAGEYMPAGVEAGLLPSPDLLARPPRTVESGLVVLRKFNFPSWKSCAPITGPLVRYPVGCEARVEMTPNEKTGALISFAAALAVLGLWLNKGRVALPPRRPQAIPQA